MNYKEKSAPLAKFSGLGIENFYKICYNTHGESYENKRPLFRNNTKMSQ